MKAATKPRRESEPRAKLTNGSEIPQSLHAFKYADRAFAFDSTSCSFFEITDSAYEILTYLEKAKDRDISLAAAVFGTAAIESLRADLDALINRGYFAPDRTESKEETNAYIDALTPQVSASIKLDVSEACNLACRYCYAEGGSFGHKPMMMSIEVAKRAVDLLFERAQRLSGDSVGIVFLGGEPLVNLDLIRFVIDYSQALARKHGKRIGYSMTTNATLLNEEAIELIRQYRIGVKVSIDGTKEVHDYLRPYKNGNGSFDDAMNNVRALTAKRGYPPAVRAVVTKENLSLTGISEYLEELGFNLIGFGYAEGNCYEKNELDLGPDEWEALKLEERQVALNILDKLERGAVVKFNPYGRLLQKIHHRVKTRMRCGYARGTITVAADGRIYPCPLSPGKREPYVIGDVYKGVDLAKVRKMVADYYKVKTHCDKTCWANHICGGPCPTYVAHESGRHIAPDRTHCDFVRGGYEFGIWFYQQLKERHPDYLDRMLSTPA